MDARVGSSQCQLCRSTGEEAWLARLAVGCAVGREGEKGPAADNNINQTKHPIIDFPFHNVVVMLLILIVT